MDPLNHASVPQLGGTRHIAIVEHRIIIPNDVGVLDGGFIDPNAHRHLRVIDMAKNTAMYMPLNAAQINHLRKALS